MSALMTAYWICFGFGLVYVLVAGTLGAVSHGMEAAADVDIDHDIDLDIDHDVDLDFSGDVDLDFDTDFDVDADLDVDADFDADAGLEIDHAGGADFHGGHTLDAGAVSYDPGLPSADIDHDPGVHLDAHGVADADLDPDFAAVQGQAAREARHSMPKWNPLSPLSIAGFLAAFGGTGLVALGYQLPWMLTFPIAIGGGLVMSFVLWLVIGKLMFSMQGTSEARVIDMLGLEAEVLTPVEKDMSGEIAYILEGTRYTAPARLLEGERVEKRSKVRICRMKGNMVYVRPQHKLLE